MKTLFVFGNLKWVLAFLATWGIWNIGWHEQARYPVPVYINGGTIHVR